MTDQALQQMMRAGSITWHQPELKLDGRYLDHEIPDDWSDWGVCARDGGFAGIIDKNDVLHAFAHTREDAMRWARPPYTEARVIPEGMPRLYPKDT